MPLPETLPKASASSRKKSVKKRTVTSVSRYSTGLTTADEASALSPISSAWKSDVYATTGGNYATDNYTTDNYVTEDEFDECRDDQQKNEMYPDSGDDSSFFSYMSNSILSTGTGNTSVSAESTSSSYSQIYEPRTIQKRQANTTRPARESEDKRLLPDILEESSQEDEENVETVYRKPKGKKKMVPSWKKLFKRNRSVAKMAVVPVALPYSGHKMSEVDQRSPALEQRSPASPISMNGRSHVEIHQSHEETLNDTGDIASNESLEPDQQGREPQSEVGSSLGWLSLASWLSSESINGQEKSFTEAEEGHGTNIDTPIQNKKEGMPGRDEVDSVQNVVNSVDSNCGGDPPPNDKSESLATSRAANQEDRDRSKTRRKLPAILPMPMSFMKKRKEIRRQQEEQRLRILSILESEDQNTCSAEGAPQTKSMLKQNTEIQIENPILVEECEKFPYDQPINDGAAADVPNEETEQTSHIEDQKSLSQKESGEEPDKVDDVNPHEVTVPGEYTNDEAKTDVQYLGRLPKQHRSSGKNHLKNIVRTAKAERVLQQASGSFRRKQPPPNVMPLDLVEAERYLGRKKTAKSIEEEKRLLKEMDKFVKRRLKALEEGQDMDGDTNGHNGCCSCGLFSS